MLIVGDSVGISFFCCDCCCLDNMLTVFVMTDENMAESDGDDNVNDDGGDDGIGEYEL